MLAHPKTTLAIAIVVLIAAVRLVQLALSGYDVVHRVDAKRIEGPAPVAQATRVAGGDPCTPLVTLPEPTAQRVYLLPIGTRLPNAVKSACRVLAQTFNTEVRVLPMFWTNSFVPLRVNASNPSDRTLDACRVVPFLEERMRIADSPGEMVVAFTSDPIARPCMDGSRRSGASPVAYGHFWDDREDTAMWDARSVVLVSTSSLGKSPLLDQRLATAAQVFMLRSHFGVQPSRHTTEIPALAEIESARDLDLRSGMDPCAFEELVRAEAGKSLAAELRCTP